MRHELSICYPRHRHITVRKKFASHQNQLLFPGDPKMADDIEEMAGPEIEQVQIILNTLYLCIEYAVKHVAQNEGEEAASALKSNMLKALEHGDIDMALLEERRTFDLVISKIEQLTWNAPIAERLL